MATKKKTVASTATSFGNVPGYGTVKPKPATFGQHLNSIQSGVARALKPPTFKAQTPTPKPPPGAPSAPAAPKFDVNNLPVDPAYDMQVGGFGKTRDDTIAGLEGQKTSTLADYGYSATYDDKGNVASLAVDPSNPYSKAALLKKNYDQSKTGTTNSLAARGQLNSGAMVNAQNTNDSNFLQSDNSLRTNLGSILAGIIGGERTARTDYETNSGVAYGERIGRAQSNPLYNPGSGDAPAADAPAPAAALIKQWQNQPYTATAGTNSKGQQGVWHHYKDGRPSVFIAGATR